MRDNLAVQVSNGPRTYIVDNSLGSMIRVEVSYNPTQSQVMPSTPQAKTATNNNGNWGTIASLF